MLLRPRTGALLLLLLRVPPAATKKGPAGGLADYRKALQRELGIPGVNLTYAEGGLLQATQGFKPGELVLVIPPKYVLTVQEALGSGAGSLINRNSRQLRRTLPRHFVMAMWVLYTKHVQKRKTDLWYLWLASLPRFDTCPVFWGETELRMLEEERALKRSRARQRSLSDEYESMVRVLLDAGMEEDAGEGVITLESTTGPSPSSPPARSTSPRTSQSSCRCDCAPTRTVPQRCVHEGGRLRARQALS